MHAIRYRLGILYVVVVLVLLASPAGAAPTEMSPPSSQIPSELLVYVNPDSELCHGLDRNDIPCPDPAALLEGMASEDPVERWRPVVGTYFEPEDVDLAMAVIGCESNGDPEAANPYSSARGLFQHLESEWERRLDLSGWPEDTSIYDPVANTAVAAYLVYQGGGWSNWSASGHCW